MWRFVLSAPRSSKYQLYVKTKVMAAKEEVFTLLKNQAPTTEGTISNVLACVKKHKLGTTYLSKLAKDLYEVSNKEYLGSSVASHVRALVELSKSKLDQKSVVFTKEGDIGTNPELESATETTGKHCEGLENEHQDTESCSEDREEDRQGKRTTTRYVYLFLSLIHW